MNQTTKKAGDERMQFLTKMPEPEILPDNPWQDDVLGRDKVADGLSNYISGQSVPLVISLSGHWGTGKTFLLKRWKQDLVNQKYQAIYFNAWEDDFYGDPLVAIIGQLSHVFGQGTYKDYMEKIKKAAVPFLIQNALGVINKVTGLVVTDKVLEQFADQTMDAYTQQRANKEELKIKLGEMAARVKEETSNPLVFIIDELDRCRPTFAIELLERVKHLCDIPNMVFVFGINRDELCKSIASVYGDIDASVYLRRFFDMEFVLPEIDAGKFCEHLMEKYKLISLFNKVGSIYAEDGISELHRYFPRFLSRAGLSIRDIDYCMRVMVFVGRNLDGNKFMPAYLIGALIVLRLKMPGLYFNFIAGGCRGAEVMDYINGRSAGLADLLEYFADDGSEFADGSEVMNYIGGLIPHGNTDEELNSILDRIEASLYLTDSQESDMPIALVQLNRLAKGYEPDRPEYLSQKTMQLSTDIHRIRRLCELMNLGKGPDIRTGYPNISQNTISYVERLIELTGQ